MYLCARACVCLDTKIHICSPTSTNTPTHLYTHTLHTHIRFVFVLGSFMTYQPSWVIYFETPPCRRSVGVLFNPWSKVGKMSVFVRKWLQQCDSLRTHKLQCCSPPNKPPQEFPSSLYTLSSISIFINTYI